MRRSRTLTSLTLRTTPDLARLITKLARREGRSQGQMLRVLVVLGLGAYQRLALGKVKGTTDGLS